MTTSDLLRRCRVVLETAWRPDPGYCVPNAEVYPHQWLWDSCFHSVVWAELGDDRCVTEVRSALALQDVSGFVPHMTYWSDSSAAVEFWGRAMTSTITQPPMFGHALRAAGDAGFNVDDALLGKAVHGIQHLLERPRVNGLVSVMHPWETGCDDSARWDDWCPGGYDRERWRAVKSQLVAEIRASGTSSFAVGSAGFTALVVWNGLELGMDTEVSDLRDSLAARWDPSGRTWTDADSGSGAARTLDGLLPALVDPRTEVFDDLLDPSAYGAAYGPCGVHRAEPSFDGDTYWRGPNWPQLTYLLAVAARRAGRDDTADTLMDSLRRSALGSGFAEYWNPDTGIAGGAAPQTWTALACVDV